MASRSRDPGTTARAVAFAPWLPAVGNWQLAELLGEGRWCKVYRARPAGRSVGEPADYAVKLVKPTESCDPLAIRLLQREAVVAREVSHPNLTCVLAARVKHSPHYLVMPYLEGQPLETALARRQHLSGGEAIGVARQTAEAMTALHAEGWVHSDVKPDNIFVSSTGHVTLLDLGLARRTGRPGGAEASALAGTLAYSAPESFTSLAELGPALDVYSLGVTLYRMVTGVLPFPQTDPAALAAAQLHHTPPNPRLFNPALDDAIVQILDVMLDKRPERRPVLGELVAWLDELDQPYTDGLDRRAAA
ncbi:MAG: serine/threonine protein kinase [Candidatus Anammoximicrobium sp.]|nr:serine/threonine protein kinase [Candidatus Anammoximicrobium sp.]